MPPALGGSLPPLPHPVTTTGDSDIPPLAGCLSVPPPIHHGPDLSQTLTDPRDQGPVADNDSVSDGELPSVSSAVDTGLTIPQVPAKAPTKLPSESDNAVPGGLPMSLPSLPSLDAGSPLADSLFPMHPIDLGADVGRGFFAPLPEMGVTGYQYQSGSDTAQQDAKPDASLQSLQPGQDTLPATGPASAPIPPVSVSVSGEGELGVQTTLEVPETSSQVSVSPDTAPAPPLAMDLDLMSIQGMGGMASEDMGRALEGLPGHDTGHQHMGDMMSQGMHMGDLNGLNGMAMGGGLGMGYGLGSDAMGHSSLSSFFDPESGLDSLHMDMGMGGDLGLGLDPCVDTLPLASMPIGSMEAEAEAEDVDDVEESSVEDSGASEAAMRLAAEQEQQRQAKDMAEREQALARVDKANREREKSERQAGLDEARKAREMERESAISDAFNAHRERDSSQPKAGYSHPATGFSPNIPSTVSSPYALAGPDPHLSLSMPGSLPPLYGPTEGGLPPSTTTSGMDMSLGPSLPGVAIEFTPISNTDTDRVSRPKPAPKAPSVAKSTGRQSAVSSPARPVSADLSTRQAPPVPEGFVTTVLPPGHPDSDDVSTKGIVLPSPDVSAAVRARETEAERKRDIMAKEKKERLRERDRERERRARELLESTRGGQEKETLRRKREADDEKRAVKERQRLADEADRERVAKANAERELARQRQVEEREREKDALRLLAKEKERVQAAPKALAFPQVVASPDAYPLPNVGYVRYHFVDTYVSQRTQTRVVRSVAYIASHTADGVLAMSVWFNAPIPRACIPVNADLRDIPILEDVCPNLNCAEKPLPIRADGVTAAGRSSLKVRSLVTLRVRFSSQEIEQVNMVQRLHVQGWDVFREGDRYQGNIYSAASAGADAALYVRTQEGHEVRVPQALADSSAGYGDVVTFVGHDSGVQRSLVHNTGDLAFQGKDLEIVHKLSALAQRRNITGVVTHTKTLTRTSSLVFIATTGPTPGMGVDLVVATVEGHKGAPYTAGRRVTCGISSSESCIIHHIPSSIPRQSQTNSYIYPSAYLALL
ncbi:hypothetical protein KIPB_002327 [Kipferlia bialata]|uniref:Uncharacterized protein n=1 Tax=Kipferlia bialata TaxID=797122 RepID=A0A9K3CRA1_9EUKA|nr:hypothetical protein KIPB_002327 [Kipferlia bialata]|eukprot:g2327.t1